MMHTDMVMTFFLWDNFSQERITTMLSAKHCGYHVNVLTLVSKLYNMNIGVSRL